MNRLTQIILYAVVGLVTYIFFVIVLFPLDSIISDRLADIERQTRGRFRVSVAAIDASLIFDTKFADFRLFMDDQEVFGAPRVSVGLSLFPLISGTVNVRFTADYKRGRISGRVTMAHESVIDVTLRDMAVSDLRFLQSFLEKSAYPLSLTGRINGKVYLSWPADLSNREAEINIKIARSQIRLDFLGKQEGGPPTLVLADAQSAIEVDGALSRGRISINRFMIPGPDLKMELAGTGRLARGNELVRLAVDGKFSLSEEATRKIPALALLKEFQDADGSFPVSLSGSSSNPRIKIGEMELNQILNF